MFKKVDADESSTLTADEVLALNDVLCKKYERFGSASMEYKESEFVLQCTCLLIHCSR